MNPFGEMNAFLKTSFYERKNPGETGKPAIPFITISRETGAGGHSLAEAILAEMHLRKDVFFRGWGILDQEQCEKIISEQGAIFSEESLFAAQYASKMQDLFGSVLFDLTPQEVTIRKTFYCVHLLAEAGKVILIGRGAGCLTQDLPQGVHVRLVAPLAIRIQNVQSLFHFTGHQARTFVLEGDRRRTRLISHYFHRDVQDPLLYDVVWNTARVPVELMARSLVDLVQEKMPAREKRDVRMQAGVCL